MAATTTSLNDLLPSIVAEAMFVANERSIMRGLVKNFQIPAGSGKTITVPRYPIASAATITEGNEVTDSYSNHRRCNFNCFYSWCSHSSY